jgi:hypothetical protein
VPKNTRQVKFKADVKQHLRALETAYNRQPPETAKSGIPAPRKIREFRARAIAATDFGQGRGVIVGEQFQRVSGGQWVQAIHQFGGGGRRQVQRELWSLGRASKGSASRAYLLPRCSGNYILDSSEDVR